MLLLDHVVIFVALRPETDWMRETGGAHGAVSVSVSVSVSSHQCYTFRSTSRREIPLGKTLGGDNAVLVVPLPC